jgi:hypothetical protein
MHTFATQDGAHALWVGVDPNPELTALHSAIASSLSAAIDYQPEDRPYRPHITVARLGTLAAERFFDEERRFPFRAVPRHRVCTLHEQLRWRCAAVPNPGSVRAFSASIMKTKSERFPAE